MLLVSVFQPRHCCITPMRPTCALLLCYTLAKRQYIEYQYRNNHISITGILLIWSTSSLNRLLCSILTLPWSRVEGHNFVGKLIITFIGINLKSMLCCILLLCLWYKSRERAAGPPLLWAVRIHYGMTSLFRNGYGLRRPLRTLRIHCRLSVFYMTGPNIIFPIPKNHQDIESSHL